MKRLGRGSRPLRERFVRHRRELLDIGEKLELEDSDLEELEAELARRMLELEA
ncbi:MAG TPA: hypothetical protein VLB44_08755 [Kofleriaceae bacterium]|nr:hypothetical protein [Kofleriaceae bacterium]